MTDHGSSRPFSRLAIVAGRGLLFALLLVVALPLWVVLTLAVAVLHVIRPFVTIPLGFVAVGGAAAAVYFAVTGDWASTGSAAVCSAVSGTLLVAFTALGERVDPDFGRVTRLPPWWWSV